MPKTFICLAAVLASGLAAPLPSAAAEYADSTPALSASARQEGLALTPPMGWNDWNAFGCDVSAELVMETADFFVSSGLRDAGYEYVNIDDCWMADERDSQGRLQADPEKFPDGIRAVADYVHARGLKFGIYQSAGTTTCQGYPGSLGHEEIDAQTFASWRVDYLKYDNCGAPSDDDTAEEYAERYQVMADALEATNRDIVFSICEWGRYDVWEWGSDVGGQLWRTTFDIQDTFASVVDITNQNAGLDKYAGPGAWNDPDMLEVGNGGMTTREYRSHFSLWAIMAAPLLIGTDLREASDATMDILLNQDVIDVDQDPLGVQGKLIAQTASTMTFAKPLADGDVAVVMFNKGDTARTMRTSTGEIGLSAPSGRYTMTDLWSKQQTVTRGTIRAFVPAHGVKMYRVSKGGSPTLQPATTLSPSAQPTNVTEKAATKVTVRLWNDGPVALTRARLNLRVPDGWKATRLTTGRATVPAGASTWAAYRLKAPAAGAAMATATVTAAASYHARDRLRHRKSALGLTLTGRIDAAYATSDETPGGAVFGQHGDTFAIKAAGAGVGPASSSPFGSTAAADEYGAIFRNDALGEHGTVSTTVTAPAKPASTEKQGLMIRNDMTAAGESPVGVALYVNGSIFGGSLQIGMAYSTAGDPVYDTTVGGGGPPGSGPTIAVPVQLRLVRDGVTYVGSYSLDGGSTWTDVGTVTLGDRAAAPIQDAGIFHTSGTSGLPTVAEFTGVTVS